jgi:hypothetical protein
MAEHGLPAGRADVVDLVDASRASPEMTLVLVVGDDHWEGGQPPGAATSHFQRAQAAWRQPGRGGPRHSLLSTVATRFGRRPWYIHRSSWCGIEAHQA